MKTSFIFLFLLINLIHLLNTLNSNSFRKLYTQKDEIIALKLYKFINNIPINCKNMTQKKCNLICYKDLQSIEIPLQQDDKKNMVEKLLKVYYNKTIPENNKKKEIGVVVINFLKTTENNKENKVVVRNRTTNRPYKTNSTENRPYIPNQPRIVANSSYKTNSTANRPYMPNNPCITTKRTDKTNSSSNRPYMPNKSRSVANRPDKTNSTANRPNKTDSAANRPNKTDSASNRHYISNKPHIVTNRPFNTRYDKRYEKTRTISLPVTYSGAIRPTSMNNVIKWLMSLLSIP